MCTTCSEIHVRYHDALSCIDGRSKTGKMDDRQSIINYLRHVHAQHTKDADMQEVILFCISLIENRLDVAWAKIQARLRE